jgi:HSP20 family molecular chaperone IbpA
MSVVIPLEVHHRPDSMAVTARLPGVHAEDLRVALTRDELTIEARSAAGPRACALALASPVDQRRATMRFADGVLTLHLPKLAP